MIPLNDVCELFRRTNSTECRIVSPFITLNALRRVLASIGSESSVCIYTRHDANVFMQRSSSIEAILHAHSDYRVKIYGCDSLHAKIYMTEKESLVGSANCTDRGLGISPCPNIEVLIATPSNTSSLCRQVQMICECSSRVTIEDSMAIQSVVEENIDNQTSSISARINEYLEMGGWLPSSDFEYLSKYIVMGSWYSVPLMLRTYVEEDARYLEYTYGSIFENAEPMLLMECIRNLPLMRLLTNLAPNLATYRTLRSIMPQGSVSDRQVQILYDWKESIEIGLLA